MAKLKALAKKTETEGKKVSNHPTLTLKPEFTGGPWSSRGKTSPCQGNTEEAQVTPRPYRNAGDGKRRRRPT